MSTNILGDIVGQVMGDQARVDVLMPLGADPHEFALSAKQADSLAAADLVVVNGAGIEASMESALDAAGKETEVFVFADHVTLRGTAEDEADGSDDHDHEHAATDPHIWTDPLTMEPAVRAFGETAAGLPGVDEATVAAQTASYVDQLSRLDSDVRQLLSAVPAERRVLVTNHEVFGYFAARYGFEILGAVVPSMTTGAQPSAKDLESLAATIKQHHVPAIFAETTQSTKLAGALAKEVGSAVKVVELYTESLGKPDSPAATYIGMIRTNAELIASALG